MAGPVLRLPSSLFFFSFCFLCRSTFTSALAPRFSSCPWPTAAAISLSQTVCSPGTPTALGTARVGHVSASTSTAGETNTCVGLCIRIILNIHQWWYFEAWWYLVKTSWFLQIPCCLQDLVSFRSNQRQPVIFCSIFPPGQPPPCHRTSCWKGSAEEKPSSISPSPSPALVSRGSCFSIDPLWGVIVTAEA